MKITAFTLADARFGPQVEALAASLRRHHPEVTLVWVLIPSRTGKDEAPPEIPGVEHRRLLELLGASQHPSISQWLGSDDARARGSFFKPLALSALLSDPSYGKDDGFVYLDPDLWFAAAVPEIFAGTWLSDASWVMCPHLILPANTTNRNARERNIIVSGIFNAGLLACRVTDEVRHFVSWWADKTREKHQINLEAGLHLDQKWLDFAPVYLPNLRIVRDCGINCGHWRCAELLSNQLLDQVRLWHFSGSAAGVEGFNLAGSLHFREFYRQGGDAARITKLFAAYPHALPEQPIARPNQSVTFLPPSRAQKRGNVDGRGRIAFVTTAAKAEWALARVVAASFQAQHPEVPFLVLLADETGPWLDPEAEPFEVLRLDEVLPPQQWRNRRQRMNRMEFTYSLTADVLRHLLDRGFERAVFIKQESLLLERIDGVLQQLSRHPILLTPHIPRPLVGPEAFAREANILQSGIYNVGFLGVVDDTESRRFLAWWSDRCHEYCFRDVPDGGHFEQRWLDLVPGLFEGVGIVRDEGFNLAHWNFPEALPISHRDGHWFTARGSRCSFVRFSGFEFDDPSHTSMYRRSQRTQALGDAQIIFENYRRSLREAGHRDWRRLPWFDKPNRHSPFRDRVKRIKNRFRNYLRTIKHALSKHRPS